MSIFAGSRYEGTNLIVIKEQDKRTRVLMENREPLTLNDLPGDPLKHTVQEGQDIDLLALRFGGDENLWWVIAELNEIAFPFELTIGQELLLPPRSFFSRF